MSVKAENKQIKLTVRPYAKASDVVCVLTMELKADGCCVAKLGSHASQCECFPQGSEEAVLGHCLALQVYRALCGSPAASAKSRVVQCEHHMFDNRLSFAWRTKGNGSAVRKSLGIVLRALKPGRCAADYAVAIKQVGGQMNREAFNYVADQAVKSLASGVNVVVVGKINLTKEKAEDLIEVAGAKLAPGKVDGTKRAPTDHTDCSHPERTAYSATGIHAILLHQMIGAKEKGLPVIFCGRRLVLNIKPAQWETKRAKLKDSVSVYAKQVYNVADVGLMAAYTYASQGLCSASDVLQLCALQTHQEVAKILNAAL